MFLYLFQYLHFSDFFLLVLKLVCKLQPFPFHLLFPSSFLPTLPVLILKCCLKPLSWMTLIAPMSSCLSCLNHHEFICRGHLLTASASPVGYQGNYTEHWLGTFSFKHNSQDINYPSSHWNVIFVMSGELPELFFCPCQNYFKLYICMLFCAAEKRLWRNHMTSSCQTF